MRASKCNHYEICAKIIRMLEKFSWSVKIAKHAVFSLRIKNGPKGNPTIYIKGAENFV